MALKFNCGITYLTFYHVDCDGTTREYTVEELKDIGRLAVQEEKYEYAAYIRDEIKKRNTND